MIENFSSDLGEVFKWVYKLVECWLKGGTDIIFIGTRTRKAEIKANYFPNLVALRGFYSFFFLVARWRVE